LSKIGGAARASDLAVTGRLASRHAATQLGSALAGGGLVVLIGALAGAAGFGISALALVAFTGVGAMTGFLCADASLRRTARRRRRDFLHALSAYLDLVNVLLAGGAGVETALSAAADAGDGWVFDDLRAVLLRARTTRRSAWDCLDTLGASYGVDELCELSASIRLAGEQGARVAASLSARANAMRERLLAHIEAEAHAASERMGLPTVLMFGGFLFLLGYPAVQVIAGST
jgi:Flp pilus assembly protein TadB